MYRIIWSHQAESDYLDTLAYWATHNRSNKYSLKLIKEVEKKEKLIAGNPSIGSLSEIEGIRYVLVNRKFSMYYRVHGDTVQVLAFWDNRRDPEKLPV